MALTPDRKEKLKGHRKCVTPVATKLIYHEVYQFGDKNLYRSFSCDRLWSPTREDNRETVVATKCKLSNFQLPAKRKLLSDQPIQMARRKRPKLTPAIASASSLSQKMFQTISWLVTALIIYYVAVPFIQERLKGFEAKWNCLELRKSLEDSLIGQGQAISKFCNALDYAEFMGITRLFLFTGGIGVGKTLATTIIDESFPFRERQKVVSAHSLPESGLLSLIAKSEWSLVIIDDVQPQNLLQIIDIVNSFRNHAKRMEGKAIVIINFTARSESEIGPLLEAFSHLDPVHIPFVPLDRKTIEQCFLRYMKDRNIDIGAAELNKLIDEQMEIVPLVGGTPGCKMVEKKLYQFTNV